MSKNRQSRRAAAAKARRNVSPQQNPTPSLSRGRQAARALDGYAPLRDALRELASERDEWAGIPMPMDGQQLIVEPTYPNAKGLMLIGASEPDPEDAGWIIRNSWYSDRRRADILILEKDGKIEWGLRAAFHHISFDLMTLGCSVAWGIEQEARAIQLLAGMLRHHQFKQYMLTGMFLEKSKRSGVTYMFRRLKPTVAIAARPGIVDKPGASMRILCCLCMHPIAYYAGSWAGAMCPTDDVIAHLALMRGDEAMLWRRSNQHPPYRPEAGL
jgi:hypothetical protein